MILSDKSIRRALDDKDVTIDPAPQDWQLQAASVELTLGRHFLTPYSPPGTRPYVYDKAYTIMPGECMLAATAEMITLCDHVVGRVEGKSSWGRRFVMVHSTAGFIDPGFSGVITLELVNLSKVSQILPIGEPIAQISFQWTDTQVDRPYGHPDLHSHYQGQATVTPSVIPWG